MDILLIIKILMFVTVLGMGYLSLKILSVPPKPRLRLKLKRSTPLIYPDICVVTGKSTTSKYLIRIFSFDLPFYFLTQEIYLPFSSEGWNKYCQKYPLSLRIFKGGLNNLRKIPVFGAHIAVYIWAPFAGFICGIIGIIDFIQHKRQLLKLNQIIHKDGIRYGIDAFVISTKFVKEFNRLNGQ